MWDMVLDLDENMFAEHVLVAAVTLMVSCSRGKCTHHRITKASIVPVLQVDDCLLLGEEGGQLAEVEISERVVLRQLEISLADLIQDQSAEIAIECAVYLSTDVDERGQFTVEKHWTS